MPADLMPGTEGAHPVLVIEEEGTGALLQTLEGGEASIATKEAMGIAPFSAMEWEMVLGGIKSAPRAGKTYKIVWRI